MQQVSYSLAFQVNWNLTHYFRLDEGFLVADDRFVFFKTESAGKIHDLVVLQHTFETVQWTFHRMLQNPRSHHIDRIDSFAIGSNPDPTRLQLCPVRYGSISICGYLLTALQLSHRSSLPTGQVCTARTHLCPNRDPAHLVRFERNQVSPGSMGSAKLPPRTKGNRTTWPCETERHCVATPEKHALQKYQANCSESVCSEPSNGRLAISYPLCYWMRDVFAPSRLVRYDPDSAMGVSKARAWRTLIVDWSHGPIYVVVLPAISPVMDPTRPHAEQTLPWIKPMNEMVNPGEGGLMGMDCQNLVLASETMEVVGRFVVHGYAPEPKKIVHMRWSSVRPRDGESKLSWGPLDAQA